jgi:hypothetical protein
MEFAFAYDHKAARDSDSDTNGRMAVRTNGLGNLYNVQRSMDSAFSVIFMCSRVSEQCHYPVTDIARDDAIKAADSFATSIVISLHKLAQIFRIEQFRQGGRSHNIAKKNCQVPTLTRCVPSERLN